jgi:hypothetical protein
MLFLLQYYDVLLANLPWSYCIECIIVYYINCSITFITRLESIVSLGIQEG